jgi:hypothetical protein
MELRHLRFFVSVAEALANLSIQFAATANSRFQFQERSQLFTRSHNETLSVVAACVSNEECSPV